MPTTPRLPARRTPLPGVSRRRTTERPERGRVRAAVIARDGGRCQAWGMAGVAHDHATAMIEPGAEEVHEVSGGSARSTAYLDPERCITLCHAVNGWVSNGSPLEAERRGLRVPVGAGPAMLAEAERLRAVWRHGGRVNPSWFTPESEE
jgi:hypothetical protein